MNIALAGFVIIILLLPGLLFRKGYLSGEFSREYIVEDFFELLINSLIPSFLFYVVIGLPLSLALGYTYDLQYLLGLLSSDKDLLSAALANIEHYKYPIIGFHLALNALAYYSGYKFKDIVASNYYDTRLAGLRFDNIWHYLLTAKFMLFKRSQIELANDSIEDIDLTYVFALVNVGNNSILYNGVLVDYELSKDGSLDLLYLKEARRKVLNVINEEDTGEEGFKDIEGNIMILKYENIINLSISFIATDFIADENGEITAVSTRLIS